MSIISQFSDIVDRLRAEPAAPRIELPRLLSPQAT
jgi:hypothetical protein